MGCTATNFWNIIIYLNLSLFLFTCLWCVGYFEMFLTLEVPRSSIESYNTIHILLILVIGTLGQFTASFIKWWYNRFYWSYYDRSIFSLRITTRIISYAESPLRESLAFETSYIRRVIFSKLEPYFKESLKEIGFNSNNFQPATGLVFYYVTIANENQITMLVRFPETLINETENSLRKAMFCNTVTFWLLVFYYRVFMGLEIDRKRPKKVPFTLRIISIKDRIAQVVENHRLSTKTRFFLWKLLYNEFFVSTFFVKRFKKINDLIWQDGFLIDFLQKKVVDKWIRGFVIFSGNLFSERLLFDRVVRFYIDFIIRPLSLLSIYEFNSPGWVVFITFQILVIFFLGFNFQFFGKIFYIF